MFSRCTKEYVHINIYFLNNQMNASVFYTQLTYCTLRSCKYHCVSRVFIYFFLQVWNCGVWCFDFSLGFSLSRFCIITTLVFHIIFLYHCCLSRPNLCQTLPTYSSLWAVIRWLANCLWAPVLLLQEKHLESSIPPGSKWQWRWQESELDSGQSHIHSDNSVVNLFTWTHAGS